MARTPMVAGALLRESMTFQTDILAQTPLQDVLVVHGPFGWSGVYPLDLPETAQNGWCVRHCGLYFVKLAASVQVRQRAAVVVEKTHYQLFAGDSLLKDAELCTVCLNKGCPCNSNPQARVELAYGKLVLPLKNS
ncbi:MAG: hypothetical protein HY692_01090 [Cyanobacteria bacterium NC_groundwater_1444_Ag_S-0.65um_54_12]|nr:hypothetical protein [Cyanobacteria bacterium NC_groundwater_1444_Ag_S-0.65um_54_12]